MQCSQAYKKSATVEGGDDRMGRTRKDSRDVSIDHRRTLPKRDTRDGTRRVRSTTNHTHRQHPCKSQVREVGRTPRQSPPIPLQSLACCLQTP